MKRSRESYPYVLHVEGIKDRSMGSAYVAISIGLLAYYHLVKFHDFTHHHEEYHTPGLCNYNKDVAKSGLFSVLSFPAGGSQSEVFIRVLGNVGSVVLLKGLQYGHYLKTPDIVDGLFRKDNYVYTFSAWPCAHHEKLRVARVRKENMPYERR